MIEKVHQGIFFTMQEFLADWHVRVTWIAFTVLWLMWAISWFLRHIFGGDTTLNGYDASGNAVTVDPEAGVANATTTTATGNKFLPAAPAWSQNIFNRLNRAHDMLRDSVLMLLCVLVVNTFARASTRAVMILAWIFVAFAVVWTFVEGVLANRWVRFLYTLIFFGLALTIIGLAWKQGFY